jgi:hypothetical protein
MLRTAECLDFKVPVVMPFFILLCGYHFLITIILSNKTHIVIKTFLYTCLKYKVIIMKDDCPCYKLLYVNSC